MSEALTLKYRPTNFDLVFGHKDIIKSLYKTLEGEKAKAFLFVGASGLGKTTLARLVADFVCEGEVTPNNLIEIDAATHNGVDKMRDLTFGLNMRALGGGGRKIVILDEAHRLSAAAWEASLKSIEEPPSHVYWCICTTELGKVPKTIKTRCVTYNLNPLSDDDIGDLLITVIEAEELEVEEEVLDVIIEQAEGSPRQALTYLEATKYSESRKDAANLIMGLDSKSEVIDICRFLINPRGQSWKKAVNLIGKLPDNVDAETVRLITLNYFAKALLGTKDEGQAQRLLSIVDEFSGEMFHPSEKMAPLLLAIGRCLFTMEE